MSEQTFYRWKAKYGGMDVTDAKRLKQLEADQLLDNQALKLVLSKTVKPAAYRRAVGFVQAEMKLSTRRSCRALGFARSRMTYESRRAQPSAWWSA